MFPDNYYYGHVKILRDHAGVRLPWRVPGRVQHGWNNQAGCAKTHFTGPWPKFIWSRRNYQYCHDHGFAGADPIGAPLLYARDRLRGIVAAQTPKRGSLLFAPLHSSALQDASVGMPALLKDLVELRRTDHPDITILLHWHDYQRPERRALWENEGFSTLTNGPADAVDFLDRLANNLAPFEVVATNRVTTIVFYAMALGRPAFLHGATHGFAFSRDEAGDEFGRWQLEHFGELARSRFQGDVRGDIADRELGAEFLLTPERLREKMGWSARRLDYQVRRHVQRWLFS